MRLPLRLVPIKTNLDFIGYRWVAFFLSLSVVIATFLLLSFKGINYGIDFSGGILIEARSTEVNIEKFRLKLSQYGYNGASIQNFGDDNNILIRLQPKDFSSQTQEIKNIQDIIRSEIDDQIEFRKIDYVGPKVGKELITNGFIALISALIAMLIYIWVRFDWQFGIGAILALVHDTIATFGFYVITGYEFDLSSIAAILTIIGYSINDTVVIYDRIRENLRKYKNYNFSQIINLSINETLSRTVMTVATTLLVCLALVLVGGEVLKGFSMALLFGIAFGTYSSVYVAAPILIYTGLKRNNKTIIINQ